MLHNTPGDIDSEIRRHCEPYPVEFLTGETLKEVTTDSVIFFERKNLEIGSGHLERRFTPASPLPGLRLYAIAQ